MLGTSFSLFGLKKGGDAASLAEAASQIKRDLADLALSSPHVQPSDIDAPVARAESVLSAASSAATSSGGRTFPPTTTTITPGPPAVGAGPHPVLGFQPKVDAVTRIVEGMRALREEALELLGNAASRLRGSGGERIAGTAAEETLIGALDTVVAVVARCRVLRIREAQKLKLLHRLQRQWQDRVQQRRLREHAEGSAPGGDAALGPNPWWRVAEACYRWQHEESAGMWISPRRGHCSGGGDASGECESNAEDLTRECYNAGSGEGQGGSMDEGSYIDNAWWADGDAPGLSRFRRYQPFEDPSYVEEAELVSQAFMLLDDPVVPPPQQQALDTQSTSELESELAGAPGGGRSAAAMVLGDVQLYSEAPVVTRVLLPRLPVRAAKRQSALSFSAGDGSLASGPRGVSAANGGSRSGSGRKANSHKATADLQIIISEQFSRNVQQYLSRAVKDPIHPLGRCVRAFVAKESSTIMGVFDFYRQTLRPAESATAGQGSSSVGGEGMTTNSLNAAGVKQAASTADLECELRASMCALPDFGVQGAIRAEQLLAIFELDRAEFVEAVCDLCARRFFVEKGVAIHIGSAWMAARGSSTSPSKTPPPPLVMLSPRGGDGSARTPVSDVPEFDARGFAAPSTDDGDSGFDDVSSVVSSRVGVGSCSTAPSAAAAAAAPATARRGGISRAGSVRLDVTFPLARLLPQLLAAQVELRLLEHFLASPLARVLDMQLERRCASFAAEKAMPILFRGEMAPQPVGTTSTTNPSQQPPFVLLLEAAAGIFAEELTRLLGCPDGEAAVAAAATDSAGAHPTPPMSRGQAALSRDYIYANDFYIEVIDAIGNAYTAAEQAAAHQLKWLHNQRRKGAGRRLDRDALQRAAAAAAAAACESADTSTPPLPSQEHKETTMGEGGSNPGGGAAMAAAANSSLSLSFAAARSDDRRHTSPVNMANNSSSIGGGGGGGGGGSGASMPIVGADDVFPLLALLIAMAGAAGAPSLRGLLVWMDGWAPVCGFREVSDAHTAHSSPHCSPLELAALPTASVLKSKGIEAFVRTTFAAAVEAIVAS